MSEGAVSKLAQRVTKAVTQSHIGKDALSLGAFSFSAKGLTDVSGKPTYDDWHVAIDQLQQIESGVQFWLGDMLNYGEHAYGEKYAQAVDETQADAWRQYAYVAGNIQISRRRNNLSFSVHSEVARLPTAKDQDRWLVRAADEGLTISALRTAIRIERHDLKVAAISAGALPAGIYDVVCADPPWEYDNSGFHQSAAGHYPTMDDAAICNLPSTTDTFPKLADPCVLFLWATSPRLPSAHAVMSAWGFDYKACMVWVKDRAPGLGWWLHTRHELLLIGARGSSTPQEKIDSVVEAAVSDHSRKPDEAYAAIERMFPGLRRVEIFARAPRDGWDVWGNEV